MSQSLVDNDGLNLHAPDDFPGDRPAGAADFVKAVRSALNVRFQGEQPPRVLFTNRGAGFSTQAAV